MSRTILHLVFFLLTSKCSVSCFGFQGYRRNEYRSHGCHSHPLRPPSLPSDVFNTECSLTKRHGLPSVPTSQTRSPTRTTYDHPSVTTNIPNRLRPHLPNNSRLSRTERDEKLSYRLLSYAPREHEHGKPPIDLQVANRVTEYARHARRNYPGKSGYCRSREFDAIGER